MAIAPIQRQRNDSGLQASIARSALQQVMQEQNARGQIMQEAQRQNQVNLRRQDQNFRDIQQGFFKNRQFAVQEEQRGIENDLRQKQEDRLAAKFEADMDLRGQLDPLRVQQARADVGLTNRRGTGSRSGSDPAITGDLSLPSVTGRRTFESIDSRVSEDGTQFAPRGGGAQRVLEESALPASGPPQATPAEATADVRTQPNQFTGAAVADPALSPAALDADLTPNIAAAPIAPEEKLQLAQQDAQLAQQEINDTKQQAAIAAVELSPQQAQVSESLAMFGEEWAAGAAQYFRNGNAEKVLDQRREQVKKEATLEKIEVMGENFGLGTWDAKKFTPFIKDLTTEDRVMGKIPFQQAAMQAMLAAKRRRDPKVRNLTTADIEMIDKAWPAPDQKELDEQSATIQADTAVLQLQERFKNAKTPNERAIIKNIALSDEVFGKTGDDRTALVNAAIREFETEVEPPELSAVQDAIFTMDYFKANPETRSSKWSPSDKEAQRRAEIVLMQAGKADMLTPDGALKQTAARASAPTNSLFPQGNAAPAPAPAPQQGKARKLLGIGGAAALTK